MVWHLQCQRLPMDLSLPLLPLAGWLLAQFWQGAPLLPQPQPPLLYVDPQRGNRLVWRKPEEQHRLWLRSDSLASQT